MTRRPLAWILDTIALLALGVPVLRYALAFQLAEPPLNAWGILVDVSPVTGLLFGLTFEFSIYLGIREAFRARRDLLRRWWLPLTGVGVQILAGVGIIAPVVEATHSGQPLTAVLGSWSWPWSIVLTGATVLTLVTLALTRSLRKDSAVTSQKKEIPATEFQTADCNDFHIFTHSNPGGDGSTAPCKELAFREWQRDRELQLLALAAIGNCSISTASRWRKEWKAAFAPVQEEAHR